MQEIMAVKYQKMRKRKDFSFVAFCLNGKNSNLRVDGKMRFGYRVRNLTLV